MACKKIFTKRSFLNSLDFFGFLFANTIYSHKITAGAKENIYILKVFSYKSASCGCCKKWINHFRDNGLEIVDNIFEYVSAIKNQYQIANNLRSRHSTKIDNYTIQRHIPIASINKLFKEKPTINYLAVPIMPLDSPRMEMHSHDSRSHAYVNCKVVSFSKTGKTKILDKISP
tara:strand:+ start:62 stop:580 length:519 start_codon:yes stop_codon:yes gene_type:complete